MRQILMAMMISTMAMTAVGCTSEEEGEELVPTYECTCISTCDGLAVDPYVAEGICLGEEESTEGLEADLEVGCLDGLKQAGCTARECACNCGIDQPTGCE